MDYSANFPNSFTTDLSGAGLLPASASGQAFDASAVSFDIPPDGLSNFAADYSFTFPPPTGWNFICAPEEISWTNSNAVNRVEMFGTNNPPAVSGTRGLREFSLNNALVEGFTRNKKVEAKVSALEDLLKYKSSLAGGFVNVPVYQVWANQKGYGGQAYFLIKSVQVKEKMRDLAGDTTRAYVDVSFIEVPAFQVDSGIDQAPFSQQGSNSSLAKVSAATAQSNLVTAQAAAQTKGKASPAAKPKK